jgi:hypothetical protein
MIIPESKPPTRMCNLTRKECGGGPGPRRHLPVRARREEWPLGYSDVTQPEMRLPVSPHSRVSDT